MNKMSLAVLTAAIVGGSAFVPAQANDWSQNREARAIDRIENNMDRRDLRDVNRAENKIIRRDTRDYNHMVRDYDRDMRKHERDMRKSDRYYDRGINRDIPGSGTIHREVLNQEYVYPGDRTMYQYHYPATQEYRYAPNGQIMQQEYQYRNPTWR